MSSDFDRVEEARERNEGLSYEEYHEGRRRPLYEVKVWVQIHAKDEDDAQEKVHGVLDGLRLGERVYAFEIEGEGSTREVDE